VVAYRKGREKYTKKNAPLERLLLNRIECAITSQFLFDNTFRDFFFFWLTRQAWRFALQHREHSPFSVVCWSCSLSERMIREVVIVDGSLRSVYEGKVRRLQPNQIFVFESNLQVTAPTFFFFFFIEM
jgi:hypothetical protein